jgi:TonB family protein
MKIFSLLPRFGVVLLCCVAATLQGADAPKKNGYTVMVEVRVNEEGKIESASVVNSEDVSAGEVLTKMAVAMALRMDVPPQQKNGKPVRATFRAPFFFPIEDDEGPEAAILPIPRPKPEAAVMPAYPPALREAGVVGGAVLELSVDEEGKLTHLTTLRASHPEFEAAAKDALHKWAFVPAQRDGKPVASRSRVAIVFETESEMADLEWRIAPRPKLGSFVVIRPDSPIEFEQSAEGTEQPAAEATPAPQPAAPTK